MICTSLDRDCVGRSPAGVGWGRAVQQAASPTAAPGKPVLPMRLTEVFSDEGEKGSTNR